MCDFETNEKPTSQIPAVQLLVAMGYEYLSPEEALSERQGRTSNVLLENILRNQLKELNRIRYKGGEYLFSEENIQSAIQKLKNIKYDGLLKTNEVIYDLITLGTAMEQTIEGDSKSFNMGYFEQSLETAYFQFDTMILLFLSIQKRSLILHWLSNSSISIISLPINEYCP